MPPCICTCKRGPLGKFWSVSSFFFHLAFKFHATIRSCNIAVLIVWIFIRNFDFEIQKYLVNTANFFFWMFILDFDVQAFLDLHGFFVCVRFFFLSSNHPIPEGWGKATKCSHDVSISKLFPIHLSLILWCNVERIGQS